MKVIHVDMDQFFAAVEQRDNPELKGKPIAVGHDAERGVVSTASYEARRFGVHSAQSIQVAKRLCPQLIIVEPHFQRYKEVSAQLHEIFHDYTDLIEPISLDEAFLDVTNNKKGIELGIDIAKEIKQRIYETTGLTASAGIPIGLGKVQSIHSRKRCCHFFEHYPVEVVQRDCRVHLLANTSSRPLNTLRNSSTFSWADSLCMAVGSCTTCTTSSPSRLLSSAFSASNSLIRSISRWRSAIHS